jgi:hypothetical protein
MMNMRSLIERLDKIEKSYKILREEETRYYDGDGVDVTGNPVPNVPPGKEVPKTYYTDPKLDPQSDGDRNNGPAPIINVEPDGTRSTTSPLERSQEIANAKIDKALELLKKEFPLDVDSVKVGPENNLPGDTASPADKFGSPKDNETPTSKFDSPKDNQTPTSKLDINPNDINKFVTILTKCKAKPGDPLSETLLTESFGLFRLLMSIRSARLRAAYLKLMGMNRANRTRLFRMNPRGYNTGNYTQPQQNFIQRFADKGQSRGSVDRNKIRQMADQLKDNPKVAQDLSAMQSNGGLWSLLSKVATAGTLGFLGYEVAKALFGDKKPPDDLGALGAGGALGGGGALGAGGASGDQSSLTPQTKTNSLIPIDTPTKKSCLTPQEISDLDTMADKWKNVNDPGIKALVAAWDITKPLVSKISESKYNPRDMKSLIALVDDMEHNNINEYTTRTMEYDDEQVDEFIKGNVPQQIAAWRKHIQDFKDKGMMRAADDAEQAMKKVHPDHKQYPASTPTPEFRGSIARALMQDMGVDDQDVEDQPVPEIIDSIRKIFNRNSEEYKKRQAQGLEPPDGWSGEPGTWMGPQNMVPVTTTDGTPVRDGSGNPVTSLGPAPIERRDRVLAPAPITNHPGDASDQAAGAGANAMISQANAANVQEPLGGSTGIQTTIPAQAYAPLQRQEQEKKEQQKMAALNRIETEPYPVDQKKLARFKELLNKTNKIQPAPAGGNTATNAAAQTPAQAVQTQSTQADVRKVDQQIAAPNDRANAPSQGSDGGERIRQQLQQNPQQQSAGKFPQTAAEIKAFQQQQGLKPDGLIGKRTLAALKNAGITPPPGFQPVADKKVQPGGGSQKPANPLPGKAVPGADISKYPMPESLLSDDRILALIRKIR